MIRTRTRVWPLVLAALTVFATGRAAAPQGFPPAAVIVAEVLQQRIDDNIRLVGTVRPRRTSVVAGQTEGLVVKRLREDGQTVAAGAPIFRLVNDQLQAALAEARADVDLQTFNHEQSLQLYETDAISEQEVRDAAYQLARAKAKLQDLAAQDVDLLIRAPFSGHLVESFTEVGQWLNRGGPVARLIATDTVRVFVDVPEGHIGVLKVGDQALVFVDALGGQAVDGRIFSTPAEGYAESHSFPVVVEVPNPDGRLKSNMSAQVGFAAIQADSVTLVHKDALVNSPMGQMVYLAVDDKAVAQPVKVGQGHQGYIAVEGDLTPGSLVIVRGNERLQPGQAVRIVRQQQ
ncbi:MAG: efflux RND transporter periplasmic adaptor subunit [Candidatus Latescibacteria bacterium]|nr:efflux RND transporter periplasmic adaptor subunit [Candidatus Latescibacterota bacterium]